MTAKKKSLKFSKTPPQSPKFRGTSECPDCGNTGATKNFKKFKVKARDDGLPSKDDKTLLLCSTCYRLRSCPSCNDILKATIELKELVGCRHEKLWGDQIKKDRKNCNPRGTPATLSLISIQSQLKSVVESIILHHSITEKLKREKKRTKK